MQNALIAEKLLMVKMRLRNCSDTEIWATVAQYLSLGAVIAEAPVDMMTMMMNNHLFGF
jgi:hypothetical protein